MQGLKKSPPRRKRDHVAAVVAVDVGPGDAGTRMQAMKAKVQATRTLLLQMPMRRMRVRPMVATTNRVRAVIDPVGVVDATVML